MSSLHNYLDYEIRDPQLAAAAKEYAEGPISEVRSSENEELVHRLHEENVISGKQHVHWDKEHELRDVRPGRTMDWTAFVGLLRKILPARVTGGHVGGLLKLECWVPTANGGEWVFTCGMQPGLNHEFSTLYFDQHEVPTSEKHRGWRTVLLRLILAGVVSEEAAQKVFGVPNGAEGRRYREMLYNYRNRGIWNG